MFIFSNVRTIPTTADEETSGYVSDSANNPSPSPDVWKNNDARSGRPRMRLPSETTAKLPDFHSVDEQYSRKYYDDELSMNSSRDFTQSKNMHIQRNHSDIETEFSVPKLVFELCFISVK